MGDGECAVLSFRHPLAEFRNPEACHREQLKGRCRNWGAGLGLSQVKGRPAVASPHDDKSSTWPSVRVIDMEPGSSSQVGDAAGDGHDKRVKRQNSRWDIGAESVSLIDVELYATPEGPACELKTAPEQVAGLIGTHEAGHQLQAGTHRRGPVVEQCGREGQLTTCCNVTGVANDVPASCQVNPGREQWQAAGITECSNHLQESFAKDKHSQNEQLCGISEGSCIHPSRDANAESSSHLINQETVSGSSMSRPDGGCGLSVIREDRKHTCEIMFQSDKSDKVSEPLTIDYRRGGQLPYSRNEKVLHTWEHSTVYDLHESKQEAKGKRTYDLHYSIPRACEHSTGHDHHGSKNESKEKRSSDHELHYSPSRTGCRAKENGDGFSRSIATSDSHVTTRDEIPSHQVERDSHVCQGHHKTRGSLNESQPSSGHEEFFKHRNVSERYTVRSSFSDKSESGIHGRDYHSRSGNHTDRNGFYEKRLNGSGGRSQSVRRDGNHHREQRSLDGKEMNIHSQDHSVCYHGPSTTGPSTTAGKDDSWPEEMDVPMDLSPAPAEDNTARSFEAAGIETVDSGQNEHIVSVPHDFYVEPNGRGWIYLDSEGIMQGPIELNTLKSLLGEGKLQSDHMVKLDGSNEWFTLEHAGSIPASFGEAVIVQPAQSLKGENNAEQCLLSMVVESTFDEKLMVGSLSSDLSEDFQIDKRVEQLMQGFTLVPGREKEVILEALDNAASQECLKDERDLEESLQSYGGLAAHWNEDQLNSDGHCFEGFELNSQISRESITRAGIDSDADMVGVSISGCRSAFQSSRKWTTRGGDWKLMCQMENVTNAKDLASLERLEKMVLNQAIPLCERRHPSLPDPRRVSSLYEVSKCRTLELPHWAFHYWEAKKECCKTALENVNAISAPLLCTPKSQASTPRDGIHFEGSKKFKASKVITVSEQVENPTVNSVGVALTSGHLPSVLSEQNRQTDCSCEKPTSLAYQELECSNVQLTRHDICLAAVDEMTEDCIKPVQQVPRKEDLRLEMGEWFYQDGTGQEIGPFTYMQLQSKAQGGLLYEGSSVYRKSDETWVPLCTSRFSKLPISEPNLSCPSKHVEEGGTMEELVSQGHELLSNFHQLYPQFMGYMCGKLHEHVMRSYKSRDFAAMLHEGSRNCFGDKKCKKVSTTDISAAAVSVQSENSSNWSTCGLPELKVEGDRLDLKQREGDAFERVSSAVNTSSGSSCVTFLSPSALVAPAYDVDFSKDHSMGKTRSLLDIGDGRMRMVVGAEKEGRSWSTEPMDCDTPHSLEQTSETSQVARSNESAKRVKLQSFGKFMKVGADISHFKMVSKECALVGSHARDLKHKQKSVYSSGSEVNTHILTKGDFSPAVDRKLEKDMAHVLQTLKDTNVNTLSSCQVSDSKKVSSARFRALAYLEIEDKMRCGSYPANMQGFGAFMTDLFGVSRMLFRIKDKEAGKTVFTNTFRLITPLQDQLKGTCILHSKPYKRKHQEYKSSSSLAGRKRRIGDAMKKQGMGKRRKGLDESSEDDEGDYHFTYKTETSGSDKEDDYFSHDDEDEDTDESDSEVESESEGKGQVHGEKEPLSEDEADSLIWGARMTKASMVPPATRKYELIEEYVIVADVDEVRKRMGVNLPKDYDKIVRAQEDRGIEYSHLEMPELREYKPRKRVHEDVLEQEVYGIDPYTHNLFMDSMPANRSDFPDTRRHQLIEEDLLKALNQEVRQFTGTGKAPTKYPLEHVVNRLLEECLDSAKRSFVSSLSKNMRSRKDSHMKDNYVAYRKGLGVVCNHPAGFDKDEFVVEFFGEVYPAWRWFEKQDAIRSFQKKDKDPAPEFYNIFLERPKGDASGYDLVVVDAMHKANYASRICHSCHPNCEARVTAVNGWYQIGVYTLRSVEYGEELTFDYNSITESKEEHETSVCLCGSHVCRGSYLNFAGPETFQEIMKDKHGLLHRHHLLLQASIAGLATKEDWDVLQQAGLGSCLLDGLPGWTIKYAAGVVRFVYKERKHLPSEILKHIQNERRMDRASESEAFEAEIQADGVFNTRLQNLAITLDKVRYVFKNLYGDPKTAPPPLRKLEPAEVVMLIWKHEDSVVAGLLHGMAYHSSKEELSEFKRKVREHEPSQSGNVEKNLQQSLLWLRDELCKAPISCVSRHDAAADLIHMYAYTKLFFTSQDYLTFDSSPLTISPLDLGPKHAHKLAASSVEWTKTYSKDYVLGQLISWYKHNVAEPGASLAKASRGCLALPDPTSCYAKSSQQRLVYGSMDRLKMFRRMEQKPQRQWRWKGQLFWEFKNNRRLFGSPMMDSICQRTSVNKEMMDWLKKRTRTFEGPWDSQ